RLSKRMSMFSLSWRGPPDCSREEDARGRARRIRFRAEPNSIDCKRCANAASPTGQSNSAVAYGAARLQASAQTCSATRLQLASYATIRGHVQLICILVHLARAEGANAVGARKQ